jgi:hypothetical protein
VIGVNAEMNPDRGRSHTASDVPATTGGKLCAMAGSPVPGRRADSDVGCGAWIRQPAART